MPDHVAMSPDSRVQFRERLWSRELSTSSNTMPSLGNPKDIPTQLSPPLPA